MTLEIFGDTSALRGCDTDPVIVRVVDPRDIDWEDSNPVFRVHFRDLHRQGATTEFELTEGDVFEVLAWARTSLPTYGSEFHLYLRLKEGDRSGLVLLATSRES